MENIDERELIHAKLLKIYTVKMVLQRVIDSEEDDSSFKDVETIDNIIASWVTPTGPNVLEPLMP